MPDLRTKTRAAPQAPPRRKRRPRRHRLTAATADRHQLYQWAVQSPDNDVDWLTRVYRRKRGQAPQHLREDFCGTGYLAATWVGQGQGFTAEGYDIDPEPVSWGLEHNLAPLGPAAARATLYLEDARTRSRRPPDIRVALNFSYWIFKRRAELLDYFRRVYRDLPEGAVFVLDTYGGPEAFNESEELRTVTEGPEPFTYVWDQARYWPVTGDYRTFIHFRFRDGSEIKRAFTYDWRLWGLPELQDVLADAGFTDIETYWEGTAANGTEGNGVFRKSRRGENCLAWVTYVMAWK
ncbi:class I SAM-dependent methyltransferase [Haliangium sp.]|uniref:class I SAM-dependent methyltransferase n=1 Tax=Haliangium sp. TaxID=2663208 RepID=UPI003D143376